MVAIPSKFAGFTEICGVFCERVIWPPGDGDVNLPVRRVDAPPFAGSVTATGRTDGRETP
jgi:hypothetical protein